MEKQMWLVYAVAAGLCWGTYVPLVQQGIAGLARNAFASFLCVGMAYFLIAVIFPIGMFVTKSAPQPTWTGYGITFATLAGTAGALGALFVIFANRSAIAANQSLIEQGLAHQVVDYRMYIGPVIFALAPVLNTVVSLFWHPSPSTGAFSFGIHNLPGWKFYLGILLTGAGAALVLYSKEEAEHSKAPTSRAVSPAPVVSQADLGNRSGQ